MANDKTWLERASAHMAAPNAAPIVVDYGRGSYLWDIEGRKYLDFSGGIGVNALGHAHPGVVAAISAQAARYCHTANHLYHRGYIELCERLCELSFGERVFLANSGTEANEAALKIARRHFFDHGEQRTEFVAAKKSFHGRTLGSLAATGQPAYWEGFGPLVPGFTHVAYGDLDALSQALGPATAAVILEPILGNAGVVVPPPGYFQAVRQRCDQAGCLLIVDEVQTGVGRTGKWFAHQYEGIEPDIMTLAKAVGGGLPLGAVVTTDTLAQIFKPGVHASTFGGNPVACAAGLATLRIIEEERLLENARTQGEHLLGRLRETARGRPCVQEVRGRGLMIGIELAGEAKSVQSAARNKGLLVTLAGKNVVRLLPPLNTSREEVEMAVKILDQALAFSQP